MPKHVVDDLGGKRTDAGNLGAGIYFADEFRWVCMLILQCFQTFLNMPDALWGDQAVIQR